MKRLFQRYVALLTCMLLLFSMVTPHPHHRDGTPCCQSVSLDHSHGNESKDSHNCSCDSHNLAVFDWRTFQSLEVDVDLCLMPLCILFDYVYPPKIVFYEQFLERGYAQYVEALYDAWYISAVGLRAPPMA